MNRLEKMFVKLYNQTKLEISKMSDEELKAFGEQLQTAITESRARMQALVDAKRK